MKLIEVDALKEMLDKIPARRIENSDGRAYALIRLSTVFEIIKQLPSAQPERKTGTWNRYCRMRSGDTFVCNRCGSCFVVLQGEDKMNFCPNCGADMSV